jgi:hypothetical protein
MTTNGALVIDADASATPVATVKVGEESYPVYHVRDCTLDLFARYFALALETDQPAVRRGFEQLKILVRRREGGPELPEAVFGQLTAAQIDALLAAAVLMPWPRETADEPAGAATAGT